MENEEAPEILVITSESKTVALSAESKTFLDGRNRRVGRRHQAA